MKLLLFAHPALVGSCRAFSQSCVIMGSYKAEDLVKVEHNSKGTSAHSHQSVKLVCQEPGLAVDEQGRW